RACDDDRSDLTFGLAPTCVVDAVPLLVDHSLCDAYNGTCGSAAEPWRCANGAAAAIILDCTVLYTRALGNATVAPSAAVCPGHSVAVPSVGITAGCAMTLIGGVMQEGYQAGLRMLGTTLPPAPVYAGCDAELALVAASNGFLPQPDEWVLVVADSTMPAV